MIKHFVLIIAVISSVTCLAANLPEDAGVHGGLIVVLDAGSEQELIELQGQGTFLVHGLVRDAVKMNTMRNNLAGQNKYGSITVGLWNGAIIPFVSDTVNVIVSGDNVTDEMRRVLAPYGVAVDRECRKLWAKPFPKEMDEWSHAMHAPDNNAVAMDTIIGPPRRVKWVAGPEMLRHHDHMSSMNAMVTSKGRLFYIFDEATSASILFPSKWSLIARDAFNGVLLWKKPIPEWCPHLLTLKSMPATLPRRLVSVGDDVFVTLGIKEPVAQLSAIDGTEKKVFAGSERCEEIIVTDKIMFALRLTGKDPLEDLNEGRGKKKGLHSSISQYSLGYKLLGAIMSPLWLNAERRLIAYDRKSGKELWSFDGKFAPMSLATDGEKVYFHDTKSIVALDAASGEKVWTSPEVPVWQEYPGWYGAKLVIHKDVIIFSGGENMAWTRNGNSSNGGHDTMTAFSAVDGKKLWTADHPPSGFKSPEDLFVAQGLVWAGNMTSAASSVLKGLDLRTGKPVKEYPIKFAQTFHHRCYPAKATENYLLASKIGVNSIGFKDGSVVLDDWVRGACGYGFMPANGVIYRAPDPCNCYPESKFNWFAALAPAEQAQESGVRSQESGEERLEKGKAYEEHRTSNIELSTSNKNSWLTYRGNAARGGSTRGKLPENFDVAWKIQLKGELTAPVSADGKVYVALKDSHTVVAVDAQSGKVVWKHVAGGLVDSPPTILGSLCIFGSADGKVTCLKASDGKLVWRRLLAPVNERIVDDGHVASAWPVQGSVLYHNGLIYTVAGRSKFTDGGLYMYGLDPMNGEVKYKQRHEMSGSQIRGRDTTPASPDILSAVGKNIFMRSQTYDLECKLSKNKKKHMFSVNGFLNDTWFHRSFWSYADDYGGSTSGFVNTGEQNHSGRIMVTDETHVYGFGRKKYQWGSTMDYRIYAAELNSVNSSAPAKQNQKGSAKSKARQILWSVDAPILARCMLKVGDSILLAGPAKLYKEPEIIHVLGEPGVDEKIKAQSESWENDADMIIVSAVDGSISKRMKLPAAPVWDGMAVAGKALYMSGKDGCLYKYGK
ncbi:PQQ-binding-like beta-propeller repeat protein [Verrucomicrobiota bacterium]